MDIKRSFWRSLAQWILYKAKVKSILLKVVFLASELPSLRINQGCNLRTAIWSITNQRINSQGAILEQLLFQSLLIILLTPLKASCRPTHTCWWFPRISVPIRSASESDSITFNWKVTSVKAIRCSAGRGNFNLYFWECKVYVGKDWTGDSEC